MSKRLRYIANLKFSDVSGANSGKRKNPHEVYGCEYNDEPIKRFKNIVENINATGRHWIVMIRHGQADHNVDEDLREFDTFLTRNAMIEAIRLGKAFERVGLTPLFRQVYSSPFKRAKQTAELVTKRDDIDVCEDLREVKNKRRENYYDQSDMDKDDEEKLEDAADRLEQTLASIPSQSFVAGHGFALGQGLITRMNQRGEANEEKHETHVRNFDAILFEVVVCSGEK